MAATDIGTNNDDLIFENGDFKISFSDNQHVEDIIKENIGAYKQYPLCGVGINNYLNSSRNQQELNNEIKRQLTADGMFVNEIEIENQTIYIDAVRN